MRFSGDTIINMAGVAAMTLSALLLMRAPLHHRVKVAAVAFVCGSAAFVAFRVIHFPTTSPWMAIGLSVIAIGFAGFLIVQGRRRSRFPRS